MKDSTQSLRENSPADTLIQDFQPLKHVRWQTSFKLLNLQVVFQQPYDAHIGPYAMQAEDIYQLHKSQEFSQFEVCKFLYFWILKLIYESYYISNPGNQSEEEVIRKTWYTSLSWGKYEVLILLPLAVSQFQFHLKWVCEKNIKWITYSSMSIVW